MAVRVVAVGLVALLVSACVDRAAAQKLAASGLEASQSLETFYQALISQTNDIWELEAFNSSVRGIPLTKDESQLLRTQIDALQGRVLLARRLRGAYSAFQALAAYDATTEAGTAAGNLAAAINGMVPLPHGGNSKDLFGGVVGDLTGLKQNADFKKAGNTLMKLASSIAQLVAKEKPLYASIAQERGIKVADIGERLLTDQAIIGWPLLQPVPETLGLKWATPDKPVTKKETIDGLVALLKARNERFAGTVGSATDGLESAFESLADAHSQFNHDAAMDLAGLTTLLDKVAVYVKDMTPTDPSHK